MSKGEREDEEYARLHARDIEGEQTAIVQFPYAVKLLERAAQSLHDYCADANGDLNDSLGTEINTFIEEVKKDG